MRDQLDFAVSEIRRNSKSPEQHIKITEREISDHKVRIGANFPNVALFTIPTGKVYGDVMQDIIIDSFLDVKKHIDDTKYDADCGCLRLEIKSLRAINGKENKESYIVTRIFNIEDDPKTSMFSTSSFQQSKPSFCDWFVFHILYGNADRLFLIPSRMVSRNSGKNNKEPGKMLLSKQHGTSPIEGQINLCEVLKYKNVFEIPNYTHSGRYNFLDLKEQIDNKLQAIKYTLPE
ncbi:MAG: hypothetical protein IJX89_01815 [Alphaproteobacteria bacterium]|nr:hypothetical protein [Alphaproteobacteria bacterium]